MAVLNRFNVILSQQNSNGLAYYFIYGAHIAKQAIK